MPTEYPDATPQEPIRFRVSAIERFALPNLVKQHHMVLRVEYLDPEDPLRGASFDLSPERYRPYREAIDEALASGATYWVDWDYAKTPNFPLRLGESAAERLLRAIGDRQIVSTNGEE